MSLTKEQTDAVIISQVTVHDSDINTIYFRNTSNTHPKDCSCDLCKSLKFTDGGQKQELAKKTSLGWYVGD